MKRHQPTLCNYKLHGEVTIDLYRYDDMDRPFRSWCWNCWSGYSLVCYASRSRAEKSRKPGEQRLLRWYWGDVA